MVKTMLSEERGDLSESKRNKEGLAYQNVKQPKRGSQRKNLNSRIGK